MGRTQNEEVETKFLAKIAVFLSTTHKIGFLSRCGKVLGGGGVCTSIDT